jgi:hypothetical protein
MRRATRILASAVVALAAACGDDDGGSDEGAAVDLDTFCSDVDMATMEDVIASTGGDLPDLAVPETIADDYAAAVDGDDEARTRVVDFYMLECQGSVPLDEGSSLDEGRVYVPE